MCLIRKIIKIKSHKQENPIFWLTPVFQKGKSEINLFAEDFIQNSAQTEKFYKDFLFSFVKQAHFFFLTASFCSLKWHENKIPR